MTKKPPFLLPSFLFLIVTTMLWWGFAFLPLPDKAPPWVTQARVVCFGLSENGLPQNYGWLLLIGAPLMMMAAVWVLWGHELKEVKNYLKAKKRVAFLSSFVLLLFFAEAYLIEQRISVALGGVFRSETLDEAKSDLSVYPRFDQMAPELELANQAGQKMNLKSEKGKVVYVTFAFAHCQAICPTLANTLKKVHQDLGPDQSTVFIISLDPWRDTVGALANMHQQWGLPPTMHVLSGSVEEVNRILDVYKVPRSRDEKTGEVVHPALVNVIDPQGRLAYVFNGASTELLVKAGREIK